MEVEKDELPLQFIENFVFIFGSVLPANAIKVD